MPTFEGFSEKQEKELTKVHKDAKKCIDNAMSYAFKKTDRFEQKMKKYFSAASGSTFSRSSSLVMKTLSSMKLVIDTDLYKVVNESDQSKAEGTNAAMCSWKQEVDDSLDPHLFGTMTYKGNRVNVLEAQILYATASGPSKLTIYPLFWDLKTYKIDKQCRIQSYLHELSHCAAGTVDYKGNGVTNPYGMAGVRACMVAGHSAQNAENVAMFLATFR